MATFAEDRSSAGRRHRRGSSSRVARKYTHDPGGRVVVVDRRGTSILDTASPSRDAASPRGPRFATALAGQPMSPPGTRHSSTLGTDLLYVAVPIAASNGNEPTARCGSPIRPPRSTARDALLAAAGRDRRSRARRRDARRAPLRADADDARCRRSSGAAAAVGAGDLSFPGAGRRARRRSAPLAAQFNETVARLDAPARLAAGVRRRRLAPAAHAAGRAPAAAREPRAGRGRRRASATSRQRSPRSSGSRVSSTGCSRSPAPTPPSREPAAVDLDSARRQPPRGTGSRRPSGAASGSRHWSIRACSALATPGRARPGARQPALERARRLAAGIDDRGRGDGPAPKASSCTSSTRGRA